MKLNPLLSVYLAVYTAVPIKVVQRKRESVRDNALPPWEDISAINWHPQKETSKLHAMLTFSSNVRMTLLLQQFIHLSHYL